MSFIIVNGNYYQDGSETGFILNSAVSACNLFLQPYVQHAGKQYMVFGRDRVELQTIHAADGEAVEGLTSHPMSDFTVPSWYILFSDIGGWRLHRISTADKERIVIVTGANFVPPSGGNANSGQVEFRPDLNDLFYRDSSRSPAEWLSLRQWTYGASTPNSIASGAYFPHQGGPPGSATLGYVMPFDMTLVEMYGFKADTGASSVFRVRKNGATAASLSMTTTQESKVESATDVDFAAGDILSFLSSSNLTGGSGMQVTMRRRAP